MNNILEFPKYDKNTIICRICRIRPAKVCCDYEVGVIFDALNEKGIKVPIQKSYCSIALCEKCTKKVNHKDYCPEHYEKLKSEITGGTNE